jgi:hypothetical protein
MRVGRQQGSAEHRPGEDLVVGVAEVGAGDDVG